MSYKDPLIFLNDNENEPAKVLYSDFKELEKAHAELNVKIAFALRNAAYNQNITLNIAIEEVNKVFNT